MNNRTNWIDGEQKPIRPGVYERDEGRAGTFFSRWDGKKWGISCSWLDHAGRIKGESTRQSLPWRGLTCEGAKEAYARRGFRMPLP